MHASLETTQNSGEVQQAETCSHLHITDGYVYSQLGYFGSDTEQGMLVPKLSVILGLETSKNLHSPTTSTCAHTSRPSHVRKQHWPPIVPSSKQACFSQKQLEFGNWPRYQRSRLHIPSILMLIAALERNIGKFGILIFLISSFLIYKT